MANHGSEAHVDVGDDRRNRARLRALKSGKIIFNNRGSVIDCTVRNLSDAGCCVQVADPVGVPEKFELEFGATRRVCQVVWRKDDRIGVRFI